MNRKNIGKSSKTDWIELDSMTDEEIDYSDIPSLSDAFFEQAHLRIAEGRDRGMYTHNLTAIVNEIDRLIAEMGDLRTKVLGLAVSEKKR